jgi:DNA-binding PadR family transcriptional regulator
MPRKVRSNPLALAVLVSLYERPMHPYEVAQQLRTRAKQESVRLNYGSLYAVVESLERRSLITARETVREGKRPERTVYAITNAGTTEMIDWLTEIVGVPTKEYPQFMAGLSFLAALSPDEALAALRLRTDALGHRLAQIRSGLGAMGDMGLPRLFALESEYELQVLEVERDFVSALIKDIESGDLEGLEGWRSFHEAGMTDEEVQPDL